MFTKEIYWQLQLLMFLDQKDDWCSGTELANASGLNVNTIQKYLDHLLEITNKFPDVCLEKHRNHGVRLIRSVEFPLQRLLSEVIRQGIIVTFFEELLLHGSVDTANFCEVHFISMSTLRRNLDKLEKELEPLGLSLTKGGTVWLIGSEYQIRYIFFQYLWTIYRGAKELPWKIEEQMAYSIEQLSALFNFKFTNVQRSQLAVLLFVFEQRNNFESTNEILIEPVFEAPSLFNHWRGNNWAMFLFFLSLFPLFFELSESRILVKIPSEVTGLVTEQSAKWLQLFEKIFAVSIEGKEAIKQQLNQLLLFNYYLTEVHSLTGLFPIVDIEHLKQTVPLYMEFFDEFIKQFLTQVEVRNPKVTELFSLLLANTIVPYMSYRPKIKLFLLSDLGFAFEKMQRDLLNAGLSDDYLVVFVDSEKEADLVLSNMPIHYSKALQVRSTINSRDLRLIRQVLKKQGL